MPAAPEPNVNERPRFTLGTAPPAQVIPADVSVFRGGEPQDDVSVPALVGRIRRGEIPGLQTGLSQGGGTLPIAQVTPDPVDVNAPIPGAPVSGPPGGIGGLIFSNIRIYAETFLSDLERLISGAAIFAATKGKRPGKVLTAREILDRARRELEAMKKRGEEALRRAEGRPGKEVARTSREVAPVRLQRVDPYKLFDWSRRSFMRDLLARLARSGPSASRPLPRVTEAPKSPVKPSPKPKSYCERHPIRCLITGAALVAGSKRLTTSRRAARTIPRPSAPVLAAPLPLVGELPTFGRPFIGGAALDPFPLSSLQTLTQAQRSRLPSATRTCLAQCERPRRTGKCREGFFKETRARTRYKVWREYDCLTGKVTRRSK